MSRNRRQDAAASAHGERWFREGVTSLLSAPADAVPAPRRTTLGIQAVVQAEIQGEIGEIAPHASLDLPFFSPR